MASDEESSDHIYEELEDVPTYANTMHLNGNGLPQLVIGEAPAKKKPSSKCKTCCVIISIVVSLASILIISGAAGGYFAYKDLAEAKPAWTEGPCSVTCGNGTRLRTRICESPPLNCSGVSQETVPCNKGHCKECTRRPQTRAWNHYRVEYGKSEEECVDSCIADPGCEGVTSVGNGDQACWMFKGSAFKIAQSNDSSYTYFDCSGIEAPTDVKNNNRTASYTDMLSCESKPNIRFWGHFDCLKTPEKLSCITKCKEEQSRCFAVTWDPEFKAKTPQCNCFLMKKGYRRTQETGFESYVCQI